jgi:hypothetical protein
MTFDQRTHVTIRAVVLSWALLATVAGCASGNSPSPSATAEASSGVPSAASSTAASSAAPTSSAPATEPSASQEPDTGTGTTTGDVPDNAVFLTYKDPALGFSIQYVEGWQVTRDPAGVTIRDKDSSEAVQVVPPQSDVAAYVSGTDLPALRAQAGFSLIKQDTVKIGSQSLVHLAYAIPSPPDPVTGKQVPSAVDRYYAPGPNGLAIVSLSTPKGVDNVDAFRQMIGSFKWA